MNNSHSEVSVVLSLCFAFALLGFAQVCQAQGGSGAADNATPTNTKAPSMDGSASAAPVVIPNTVPLAQPSNSAAPAVDSSAAPAAGSSTAPLIPAPKSGGIPGAAVLPGKNAAAPANVPEANSHKPVADKPSPTGFGEAVKLYNSRKFPQAITALEKFKKDGTDNVDSGMYLAACYQQTKKYDAALKEYDRLAKDAPLISQKRKAEQAAHTLRCYRAGICPGNCLKMSMPGWQHLPGQDPKLLFMKFPVSNGYNSWSTHHLGEVIVYDKGEPVNKGKCPICKGTGHVPRLK